MATFILLLFPDLFDNFAFRMVENLHHIDLIDWYFDGLNVWLYLLHICFYDFYLFLWFHPFDDLYI